MSYTKGELVEMALEEIGIAAYEFDVSPEQTQSAKRRLDAMLADWNQRGILISFPIAKNDSSSISTDSNIPDWAWEAVITNLAIRIAPSYGKQVSGETRLIAKNGYNTLVGEFAKPRERQFNSMPKGAGYKSTQWRYLPEPQQEYLVDVDEEVDISGGPTDG